MQATDTGAWTRYAYKKLATCISHVALTTPYERIPTLENPAIFLLFAVFAQLELEHFMDSFHASALGEDRLAVGLGANDDIVR